MLKYALLLLTFAAPTMAAVSTRMYYEVTLQRAGGGFQSHQAQTAAEASQRCEAEVARRDPTLTANTTFTCSAPRQVFIKTYTSAPVDPCAAAPADRVIQCPTGTTGSWTQRATVGAPPLCSVSWSPVTTPPGACTAIVVTCPSAPADRQIDCPTGYTGTWTQRAEVGPAPSCAIAWSPIAFPPDACTVVSQPPPARPLFTDRFDYDVGRDITNAEQLFAGSGWPAMKANNSSMGRGSGWIYTRPDATRGGRVLVMESNPQPISGFPVAQTDYYLQLGREGSTTEVLPANTWMQFWTYATPDSRFATRDKTIYPCNSFYPCSVGPNLGWLFMWGSGGFNTGGNASARRFLALEAANADNRGDSEYPTNKVKLSQNVNATPLAGGTWYQVRLHINTSGAQGEYEAWVRAHGTSAWTKVSDWRGGQTANFFWPIPADQRRGHTMFRMPTTVNGPGNSITYLDDFVIANSQSALPTE